MDSSFFLTTVASAIRFFTLFRKLRSNQEENEETNSSSSPQPSLSLSSPSSSLCRNWTHHVFPSFRGEDVRRDFLSHIQKEFQRKGITPFIDNEIKRGESIGPEIIRVIRGSKIAIIVLSRNYASSSWCLDELVEIMKCREELGQTVMAVFYKVDPSEVKKLSGDFAKIFRQTCKGKTKEEIWRWRQALAKLATIAGYHSSNWDTEAAMIEKISTDISNKLNSYIPSRDFDCFIGMGAHLEKMESLLRVDSDEVRMIGIWGPPGVGKTTIARVAYNQLSTSFQLCVFMENFKDSCTRLCSDDYRTKLHLQQRFMSQITNHKDMEIPHLGVVQDRLKDKKVLVVFDGVDNGVQLDAMAKETSWFGPGSRIIVTTQDLKLLMAHGINHVYKVAFPSNDEALQIFCMNAFGQNSPNDGFEKLAREVIYLAGNLPLGLKIMGSYFRGMSKQEWENALPRLRMRLDRDIQSILKFSYDALDDEDKDLFLYIACFFNYYRIEEFVVHLVKKFVDVRQGLRILAQKSLIDINYDRRIEMHNLLVELGKEIARKQSLLDREKRRFLFDAEEICEALTDDTIDSKNVVCIDFNFTRIEDDITISDRAFAGMFNLQFLRFQCYDSGKGLYLLGGLNNQYRIRRLRILHWEYFPMTRMPSIFNPKFLVEVYMNGSKLEKLWDGIQSLGNLWRMDLSDSVNLKELPDLSTSTNLERLTLTGCTSLVGLPFSIGNATSLHKLELSNCSNLVELPSSIGNLRKLMDLNMQGCSKLEVLPNNINLESLDELDLTDCLLLKTFPEISTNIKYLNLKGTAVEEVPSSVMSWSRLDGLSMSYSGNFNELSTPALASITSLDFSGSDMQEVPPWLKRIRCLRWLVLEGCSKLVSLPQLQDSLSGINAENCESLERLDCSFNNPDIMLNFANCFKLNKKARELIIHTSSTRNVTILPGREVPAHFNYRARGGSLSLKLNERPLHTSLRFKACILLVYMASEEADDVIWAVGVKPSAFATIKYKQKGGCTVFQDYLEPIVTEHLYIFEFEAEVTSSEFDFEFGIDEDLVVWKIAECGVLELFTPLHVDGCCEVDGKTCGAKRKREN